MKYKWDKKYLYWGITAFCVVVCSIIFYLSLSQTDLLRRVINTILNLLSPFLWGLVIAYLLNPVMKFFQRFVFGPLSVKLFRKKPQKAPKFARAVSTFAALAVAIALIVGLLVIILPQLYLSIVGLISEMPGYLNTVLDWIDAHLTNYPGLEETVSNLISNATTHLTNWIENSVLPQMDVLITNISSGVFSIVQGILDVLIGFVVSVYLLINKERFQAQSKRMLYSLFKPKRANFFLRWGGYCNDAFGGFLTGQILDALIVGIICAIFLSIMGMPYVALISLMVGITNIIPFFGPFIGAIPSALLILLESPLQCLIFVVFIIVLQQVDGNIICPKIVGSSTGLNGFWVMFAIIVGGGLFGFVGMIFGVPVFSLIYMALRRFSERRLKARGLPSDTNAYRNMDHVDPETRKPVYHTTAESTADSDAKPDAPSKDATPANEDANGEAPVDSQEQKQDSPKGK